jgi:hypothetical protein
VNACGSNELSEVRCMSCNCSAAATITSMSPNCIHAYVWTQLFTLTSINICRHGPHGYANVNFVTTMHKRGPVPGCA